jgi:hypothetical protein
VEAIRFVRAGASGKRSTTMGRLLPSLFLAILLPVLDLAGSARAQGEAAEPLCAPGQDCAEVAHWGAWGLIILGLMCFIVWLEPRRRAVEEESMLHRIPMLQVLQRRLEKERAGWRRFQWPILGAFFIALGAATLAGWR